MTLDACAVSAEEKSAAFKNDMRLTCLCRISVLAFGNLSLVIMKQVTAINSYRYQTQYHVCLSLPSYTKLHPRRPPKLKPRPPKHPVEVGLRQPSSFVCHAGRR